MAKILISGGTGLVGKHLSRKLKEKGYEVAILSRNRNIGTSIPSYAWDLKNKTIDKEAIEDTDYIIHLAGENIGDKRWSDERKIYILDSRVKSAQLIFDKIKENKQKIKAFITASAIGYYGAQTVEKIFQESDSPGNDFLGDTCRQWEFAADKFEELGARVVKIRTGVVLSKEGGALAKIIPTTNMGIGSALGSGKQYMPWIHIDDLCNIYIKAIEDTEMKGAYNAVAPDQKTNKEFMHTLARVLKKPFWFPNIPSVALKILYGKMSVMVLEGSRVSPEKIKQSGYHFLFPELEKALTNLFSRK